MKGLKGVALQIDIDLEVKEAERIEIKEITEEIDQIDQIDQIGQIIGVTILIEDLRGKLKGLGKIQDSKIQNSEIQGAILPE